MQRKSHCPLCNAELPQALLKERPWFRCVGCGAALEVSTVYQRSILVVGELLAIATLWLTGGEVGPLIFFLLPAVILWWVILFTMLPIFFPIPVRPHVADHLVSIHLQ